MAKKNKSKKTEVIVETSKTELESCKKIIVKISIPGSNEPFLMQFDQQDIVNEIRQAVTDRPDCLFRTCFSIQNEKGIKLDDLVEIGSLVVCEEAVCLRLVDQPYTFRDALVHVNRFHELTCSDMINLAFEGRSHASLTLVAGIAGISINEINFDSLDNLACCRSNTKEVEPSLTDFFLTGDDITLNKKCLKSLRMSFYNPPSGYRKLVGDLLYVDIITLEGIFIGVTAIADGFCVNASSAIEFNSLIPNREKKFLTLDALISSLCKSYRNKFKHLRLTQPEKHPYEVLPIPRQVYTWLGPKREQNEDTFCALDVFNAVNSSDDVAFSYIRDWNDELQSIRQLSRETDIEKNVRNKYLYKMQIEMANSACKGSISVVEGRISSINETDDEKLRMYVWNSMFISIMCDSHDHFKEFGGDIASHVAAGLDLRGINYLNSLDFIDVMFLGTNVIDYRGFRLVVQSVLPGIFQRNINQSVDYGSVDHGKSISTSKIFEASIKKIAEDLHIVPQIYIDDSGNEHELLLSMETKGILGTDGRKYLLDFYKLFPPDPNFNSNESKLLKDDIKVSPLKFESSHEIAANFGFIFPEHYPHRLACFRPELIEFIISQCKTNTTTSEVDDPPVDDSQSHQFNFPSILSTKVIAKFSPDCYDTKLKRPTTEFNKLLECRMCSRYIASFMVGEHIPMLILVISKNSIEYIFDHSSLTNLLHSKGINVRYLGYIAHTCKHNKKSYFLFNLSIMEMLIRAAKRIFRFLLSKINRTHTPIMVSHFLNCLLGSNRTPKVSHFNGSKGKGTKKLNSSTHKTSWDSMTPFSLWAWLFENIHNAFGYEFEWSSIDNLCESLAIKRIPLLRSFCKMTGVQVLCRNYDFHAKKSSTFLPEDILDMFPLLKTRANSISEVIQSKLDYVKNIMFDSEQKINMKKYEEDLHILISYFIQVFGPMSQENAMCLSFFSHYYSILGDHKQSMLFQLKSTVLFERIFGIDDYQTIIAYYRLSICCKNYGNIVAAVNLSYRVRYLISMCYSLNHPFCHEVERNLTAYLYDLNELNASLELGESMIKYLEDYEPDNIKNKAEAHQVMASVHFKNINFKAALNEEKKAYHLFSQFITDPNSAILRACEGLLNLYLKSALLHEKTIQTKKI